MRTPSLCDTIEVSQKQVLIQSVAIKGTVGKPRLQNGRTAASRCSTDSLGYYGAVDSGALIESLPAGTWMANSVRSFAFAIQSGGFPRPVQVLPLAGSRNFGTPTVAAGFDERAVLAMRGDATAPASIANASRFFAPAIQIGGFPRPVQVLPLFGSRYFAMPKAELTGLVLPTLACTAVGVAPPINPRSEAVSPYASIASRIRAMTPGASLLRSRSASACRRVISAIVST